MKNYLVTGGAGFIGRSVVNALVTKGHHVLVLDNGFRAKTKKDSQSNAITILKGDIRNKNTVKKACKNIDSVIHLAYINGTEHFYSMPDTILDVAIKGMSNLIDACISEGVSEFFLASSSEVYHNAAVIPTPEDVPMIIPDPFNPRYSYSGGKIISELLLIHNSKHFKRSIIFRPHNVYGPNMGREHVIPQFIKKIQIMKKNNSVDFPIQGSGKESRSFIYIDDFTKAMLLLLDKGENLQIYNIGNAKETSIEEVAVTLAKIFNVAITLLPGELSAGSPIRRCPDITKLRRLGYVPDISLEQGMKKTAEWYEKN